MTWSRGKHNAMPTAARGAHRGPTVRAVSSPKASTPRPPRTAGAQKAAPAPPSHQAREYQAEGPIGNCGWMTGFSGVPTW